MTRIAKKDDGPQVRKVTWIGLAVNLGLTATKFVAGIVGHSQALFADAIHSASDLATDAAILIGSRFWNSPPDANHPNGHRRFETLISIGIGLAVIGVGVFLGYDAITALANREGSHPEYIAAAVALLSVIAKELVFRYTRAQGKKLRSQALEANAWHHRSDAFSSIPVVIAVLVSIAFPSLWFVDSVGALVVGFLIIHSGYEIIKPGMYQVTDGAASDEVCEKLKNIALNVPGVISIHEFRTRYIGSDLQVNLHIVVANDMTLIEAHDLSEAVEQALINSGENVVDALVHIDPYDIAKDKGNVGSRG